MNGKDLLDKMSDVDEKLIADAEKKPRKKRGLFIGVTSGVATVAAAAAVAVVIGVNSGVTPPPIESNISDSSNSSVSGSGNTSTPGNSTVTPIVPDPPELDFSAYSYLPKISDPDYAISAMGGGGKATAHFSLDELKIGSPWSADASFTTLPVYMSKSTDPDIEKMYEFARAAAAALGISESEMKITDTYYPGDFSSHRKMMEEAGCTEEEIEKEIDRMRRTMMAMTEVYVNAEGVELDIHSDFSLDIWFRPSVELPEGYSLSNDASDKERADTLNYLAEKYKDLLQYNNTAVRDSVSYSTRDYSLYEADGDLEQQLVNYWLNFTKFVSETFDDPDKLKMIQLHSDGGCDKLGDYPILTPEQAVAILKSNKYSDENRMPYDANIVKTDICYNNHTGSTAVIPYYKFYAATGNGNSTDEIECDVYTIAAVPEEFIDMPTNDYGVSA